MDPITPATIRAARHDLGLTQAALAADLGVHPRAVAAWEQGTARPSGLYRRAVEGVLARAAERRPPRYAVSSDAGRVVYLMTLRDLDRIAAALAARATGDGSSDLAERFGGAARSWRDEFGRRDGDVVTVELPAWRASRWRAAGALRAVARKVEAIHPAGDRPSEPAVLESAARKHRKGHGPGG